MGDGTSKLFYNNPSVLYISMHRYDDAHFYPYEYGTYEKIGEGEGEGYNIHFGFDGRIQSMEGKISDKDYIYACSKVLFPVMKEF